MRFSIRRIMFKAFGQPMDAAALVAALGLACGDIRRSNTQLGQALARKDLGGDEWRGDAIYALRMVIGHFNEAMDLIPKIAANPYLINFSCHPFISLARTILE